jgi:anhydro-N-acetylmuramic acid kinase
MERLIAGAMSGTSADGVDVALVLISGRGTDMTARLVAHNHRAYEPELREKIFSMRSGGAVRLADLARCTREISLAYASAVKDAMTSAGVAPADVAAIAAHGQTMFHAPPDTMQIFDPALLAAETGCAVVSDFRRADCAAGGQGAPLVPFADYVLFRHRTRSRVLLNIGGIANITIIPAGAAIDEVVAFDTGPGNCVSDWLMRTHAPHGSGIDEGGRTASRGSVVGSLSSRLLGHDYFEQPPPKSTDAPEMIRIFSDALGTAGAFALEDLLATACFWTAAAVEHAIGLVTGARANEIDLIASGGGTENNCIMGLLRELGFAARTTDELGVPSVAKEAIAFALLGAATLDGVPSNVPSATGARQPVVLGSITPKP